MVQAVLLTNQGKAGYNASTLDTSLLPLLIHHSVTSITSTPFHSRHLPLSQIQSPVVSLLPPGLPPRIFAWSPGPFLLSYSVFDFIFSLFFRYWAVR